MKKISLLICTLLWFGCNTSTEFTFTLELSRAYPIEPFVELKPIHYKYGEKRRFEMLPKENGSFRVRIPVQENEIGFLHLGDLIYPLLVSNNASTTYRIDPLEPHKISIKGDYARLEPTLQAYLNEKESVNKILSTLEKDNRVEQLNVRKSYWKTVSELVENTPLADLSYIPLGNWLVERLQRLKSGSKLAQEREDILRDAHLNGFFTYKSLKMQRAGSRDFTHYYAYSYNVEDSLNKIYSTTLMLYDVQREGYDALNKYRTKVVDRIRDPKGRAYAEMHLVLERLSEIELQKVAPTARAYIENYRSTYPKWTELVRSFYERMQKVQPGQPAFAFSFTDTNGKVHSNETLKGKYVLLDFWASWCSPCMEEFPFMKQLYHTMDRDKIEFIGVGVENDSLAWQAAVNRLENPWPQVYEGGELEHPLMQKYNAGGIPFLILLAPDGSIARYNDIRPSFNFEQVIDSLLAHSRKKD